MYGRSLVFALLVIASTLTPALLTPIPSLEGKHLSMNPSNGTSCGNNSSMAYVAAWPTSYSYNVGDTHNGTIYTNCNLLNETMHIVYNLTNSDSSIEVDWGTYTWNATLLTDYHYVINTNLTAGNYTLGVWLEFYDTTTMSFQSLSSSSYVFNVTSTSGSGNGTSGNGTGCGYDSNYVYLDANSYYTSYTAGETYEAYIDTHCALLGQTMRVDWSIWDHNNSMNLTGSSFQWNATYSSHYYDINYSNISAGWYTLYASLYILNTTNQGWTYLGMNNDTFFVSPSSNNTTDCGYVWNNTRIYVASNTSLVAANTYGILPGESFFTQIDTECNLFNTTMRVTYYVEDWLNNNASIDWGNWTWNATTVNSNFQHTFEGLSSSVYNIRFDVSVYWNGWYKLDEANLFVVVGNQSQNNTGPCGSDPSYAYADAWPSMFTYEVGQTHSGFISTHCNLLNITMRLHYTINEMYSGQEYDSGNFTWIGSNLTQNFSIASTNLPVNWYNVTVTYTYYSNSQWNHLTLTGYPFEVINQTTSVNPCGNDNSYASLYTWPTWSSWEAGQTSYANVMSDCNMLGWNSTVTMSITSLSTGVQVYSDTTMWFVTQPGHSFSWMLPSLNPGLYSVNTSLYSTYGGGVMLANQYYTINITQATNTSTPCGSMLSEVMANQSINAYSFFEGDTVQISLYGSCFLLNQNMKITHEIYSVEDALYVIQDGWQITPTTTSYMTSYSNSTFNEGLYVSTYLVEKVNSNGSTILLSETVQSFIVQASSPVQNLTGACSINLTASPSALLVEQNLTISWLMTGDIPEEMGLNIFSTMPNAWNVGVQYHFTTVTTNDGEFTYTLPQGLDPELDYYIYINSKLTNSFTTYCWKYGSFDVLSDNENALEEVIENMLYTADKTPRISMWYGKVNQHNINGTWMTDADGSAGGGSYAQWGDDGWGDRKIEYCQRFWPITVDVLPMDAEQIVFYTAGNLVAYQSTKPVWRCVMDTDGDGQLDHEDVDIDGDGWTDILELACGTSEYDSNDVPADENLDGICDLLEDAVEQSAPDIAESASGLSAISMVGTLMAMAVAVGVALARRD